jgi:hypothetical protein
VSQTLTKTQCPCCGTSHNPAVEARPDSAKDDFKKLGSTYKANYRDNFDAQPDDAIILRMKGENVGVPWAEILTKTSYKSVQDLKERWKEINPERHGKKEDGVGDAAKGGKNKDQDPDKDAKNARNREEGLRRQAESKAKKDTGGDDNDDADKAAKKKVENNFPNIGARELTHNYLAWQGQS